MSTNHREMLKKIRTFPSLVKYLRDELDWPIQTDDFEELTFEYTPDELGIDIKNAAKIQEIKRLRPLSVSQPWGIFFVKFEPKRLPVVALRRILSRVVVKKQASANSAERAAWQINDLLFVSNYGEGEARSISFAHFAQDGQKNDLPTLKVLGWDNLDTALHLDHVAEELRTKLAWPEDENKIEYWRQTWQSAFTLRHRGVITTSKALAVKLAELARGIRTRIRTVLAIETEDGPITKLMKAFRESLIHDLDEEGFADMYAQTIAYGLLSARITNPKGDTADDFVAQIPITNPFLKELMEAFLTAGGRMGNAEKGTGIDFDELGVSEVIELLDNSETKMEDVLRDFGDRNPQEDPVIHFYELFLKEYDAKKKMQRGVFYTPRPVVSYIVHSIDEILRKEFRLEQGLADTTTWGEMAKRYEDIDIPERVGSEDPFVQILDPATGTGTFLVEVIDLIYNTMIEKWKGQGCSRKKITKLWNSYVPKHLLSRLYGYELLMAPYAIAHMKVGIKLYETGYCFGSEERTRVYLTNALEPAVDDKKQAEFKSFLPALAHEAVAVNDIKKHKRFTLVIGNPPYSASVCEPEWLMRLLDDWKQGLNEIKSDLNREEWKFLRLGQYHCMASGAGILGLIINRDFLDGIVKRRMREHLCQHFPLRIAVDLNGDVKGNISDENVFEIEQGVAIILLSTKSAKAGLWFTSRVGTRTQKYADLTLKTPINTALSEVESVAPYFRWVPFASANAQSLSDEYAQWIPLDTVFNLKSSGIETKNDRICIASTRREMWERVQKFVQLSPQEARQYFEIDDKGAWSVEAAQADLKKLGLSENNVQRILYRPFDWRYTYYTHRSNGFLGRPRFKVMKYMLKDNNLALIFNRQIVGDKVSHFGVSRGLMVKGTFYLGNKGNDYLAPLYLPTDDLISGNNDRETHNFTASFKAKIRDIMGTMATGLNPEDILHYTYSVFHSPTFRDRYAELLKIDYPRLPLTSRPELFRALIPLGSELVALHLLESAKLDHFLTTIVGTGEVRVEKVSFSDETVWINKAKTIGFQGVPGEIWNFHIGGYQVCEKWLKDRQAKGGKNPRPGRILNEEDIDHYQKIIVALNETIRIMKDIDEVIDRHGGWPDAFLK